MLLHLVRHGQTTFNAENRIQGQCEAPLSELGRRQSQAAAESLAVLPIDAIYCSPLRRARETAQPISDRLGLAICTDPRLMELDVGVFEGQLRSDLAVTHPIIFAQWMSGDNDFAIPGGESRRQLSERGCEAMRSIAAGQHAQVVVVAHGGLLTATLRSLLNLHEPMTPFALQNGSITRLTADEHGHFTLVSLNDVDHLQAIGLSNGGDL